MKPRTVQRIVRRWFRTVGTGSLMLPDRWFGRPYDNAHKLTGLSAEDDALVIELDHQLTLQFAMPVEVEIVDGEMVISEFKGLVFDWKEYGAPVEHHDVFDGGEVRFFHPRV